MERWEGRGFGLGLARCVLSNARHCLSLPSLPTLAKLPAREPISSLSHTLVARNTAASSEPLVVARISQSSSPPNKKTQQPCDGAHPVLRVSLCSE